LAASPLQQRLQDAITPWFARPGGVCRNERIRVPVEKQHDLFRPFARAGRESSGVPGTGLGLAIGRRRAELMRAEVGFGHLREGGAAFWIDLPLATRLTPS
jgi:K+-sensing histidine kinase KdpD